MMMYLNRYAYDIDVLLDALEAHPVLLLPPLAAHPEVSGGSVRESGALRK